MVVTLWKEQEEEEEEEKVPRQLFGRSVFTRGLREESMIGRSFEQAEFEEERGFDQIQGFLSSNPFSF